MEKEQKKLMIKLLSKEIAKMQTDLLYLKAQYNKLTGKEYTIKSIVEEPGSNVIKWNELLVEYFTTQKKNAEAREIANWVFTILNPDKKQKVTYRSNIYKQLDVFVRSGRATTKKNGNYITYKWIK